MLDYVTLILYVIFTISISGIVWTLVFMKHKLNIVEGILWNLFVQFPLLFFVIIFLDIEIFITGFSFYLALNYLLARGVVFLKKDLGSL